MEKLRKKKPKILVTGGTGYIGSHTVIELLSNGNYEVVTIDNFLNSSPKTLERMAGVLGFEVKNSKIDLCDWAAVANFFENETKFDGIIHFAALKSVPDSVAAPVVYYQNNLNSLLNILKACQVFDIRNLIFSSSCSVYGNPQHLPVSENTPFQPAESPYAHTKQMGEEILQHFTKTFPLKCLSLRYFNPVGAHLSGKIGEDPSNPPTNLVPIITQTAAGLRKEMSVFGFDYPTRDGTCIRDYIHVCDIAEAHKLAFDVVFQAEDAFYDVINLGSGAGVSVLEMVKAFEKVADVSLNYKMVARRLGDVMAVYSDTSKSKRVLKWSARHTVEEMMLSAWLWQKKLAEN